jgi:hypothetical protein
LLCCHHCTAPASGTVSLAAVLPHHTLATAAQHCTRSSRRSAQ